MSTGIFRRELWTKELIAWYLYDFSNSFLIINCTVYFSQWVIIDHDVPDFFFGLAFMAASAFLVFVTPYVGELGDRGRGHRKIFVGTTIAAILAGFAIFVSGRFIPDPRMALIAALLAYGIFQFLQQLALVPYNAFLKYISPPEHYGKISGLGFMANQLGFIAGLAVSLVVTAGPLTWFGVDRLAPLLPSAIAFVVFSLPALIILHSGHQPATGGATVSFWKTLSSNLREAKQYPGVRPLILAFHLFTNAVNPILLFSAIYLEKTFGASDPFKVKTFLSVIAAYTLGAVIGGALSDKIGHRRMVLASLALTAVATIPLASVQQLAPTIIFFPIYGLGIGMVYASSRAYLASLIPSTESGRFFGLYTFAEKLGQVIGPITWTFIVLMFAGYAPGNYRIATFATGMFVLASMITIARKEKTPHHKAE